MWTASITDQVRRNTPDAVIYSIVKQIARRTEVSRRVDKEGAIVRDLRGSVIPHPGIAIELAATKAICDLLAKWSKR